jgi:MFS transporter, putative metabolite:H+ symporter
MVVGAQIGALGGTVSYGIYTYVPESFPARMRAWVTALASTVIRLESSFMPVVFGLVLSSAIGIGGAYLLAGVLVVLSGAVVVKWGLETRGLSIEEASAEDVAPQVAAIPAPVAVS